MSIILKYYYKIKLLIFKIFLGTEALNYLLFHSFYPLNVLKFFGAKIGNNVRISHFLSTHESNNSFANLTIGNNVHIGKNVFLDLSAPITIEDNVTIAMGVKILTHSNFGNSKLAKTYHSEKNSIIIKHDSYIGANALILSSTMEVGANALIGAGSLVMDKVPNDVLFAGVPGEIKKNYRSL